MEYRPRELARALGVSADTIIRGCSGALPERFSAIWTRKQVESLLKKALVYLGDAAHQQTETYGPGGTRTLDPLNAIQVRSQLRYRPGTTFNFVLEQHQAPLRPLWS